MGGSFGTPGSKLNRKVVCSKATFFRGAESHVLGVGVVNQEGTCA